MSDLQYIHVQLETKQDGSLGPGQFEGYGSVFGNEDLGGDIVEKGAFTATIKAHMAAGTMPSMFASHNMNKPIGEWLEMREDEHGLYVKGQLWVEGCPDRTPLEEAAQFHNQMRSRGCSGLSIGFRSTSEEYDTSGQYTVRRIKEADLIEVSPTTMPMNPMALTTAVKSLKDDDGNVLSIRECEQILRDAGLSKREAKAFCASGYKALRRDAEEANEDEKQDDVSGFINEFTSILKEGITRG